MRRLMILMVAVLGMFGSDALAIYDAGTGRFMQRDPIGYASGTTNLYAYVGSSPLNWLDPFGLKSCDAAIDCTNTAGLNDCEKMYCALGGAFPALGDNGRLSNARDKSGMDPLATMLSLAWKESSFHPGAANPRSTARGLYQILNGTKDDIEDRVWPEFVGGDDFPPYPPSDPDTGQPTDDWRYDPGLASSAAYAYLLDRIAAKGNDLRNGIAAYGEGDDYADKVLRGINAIKKTCGVPPGTDMTNEQLEKCASEKCGELKKSLDDAMK